MRAVYWIAIVVTLGCAATFYLTQPTVSRDYDSRVLPTSFRVDHSQRSNIMPDDYVGADSCMDCHEEQYDLWKNHPHQKMNQLPTPKSVMGDFDDAVLKLPTGEIHFTTTNDAKPRYLMTLYRDQNVLRQYEVTRTVGSRYIQSYIGRQIEGPEDRDHDIYREHKLPYSYRFTLQRWLPGSYFNICCDEPLDGKIPQDEALDGTPTIRLYTEVCKNCHNTIPYVYRIFNYPLAGFPDARIAGAVGPLSDHMEGIHGTLNDGSAKGSASSVAGFTGMMDPDKHMVSMGISCESCHMGAREHVEHEKKINFLPTSAYTEVHQLKNTFALRDSRTDSRTMLGTCAQCHSGNNEEMANGAAKGNSREAIDLHSGFCASKISCVTCHEPHTQTQLPSGGPDLKSHINACIDCHSDFEDESKVLAHSGHSAADGVSCLDCHMPRYTRGVDTLIRTHKISNPVEESMISTGAANACNACHLDKSTNWTIDQLAKKWDQHIKIDSDSPVANQLNKPVGEMWLESEDSHLRLMALQLYARSMLNDSILGDSILNQSTPVDAKLTEIIRGLNDPERINRVFANNAAAKLTGHAPGEPLPVDIVDTPARRAEQIRAWLRELESKNTEQ